MYGWWTTLRNPIGLIVSHTTVVRVRAKPVPPPFPLAGPGSYGCRCVLTVSLPIPHSCGVVLRRRVRHMCSHSEQTATVVGDVRGLGQTRSSEWTLASILYVTFVSNHWISHSLASCEFFLVAGVSNTHVQHEHFPHSLHNEKS